MIGPVWSGLVWWRGQPGSVQFGLGKGLPGSAQFSLEQPRGSDPTTNWGVSLDLPSSVWIGLGEGSAWIGLDWPGLAGFRLDRPGGRVGLDRYGGGGEVSVLIHRFIILYFK